MKTAFRPSALMGAKLVYFLYWNRNLTNMVLYRRPIKNNLSSVNVLPLYLACGLSMLKQLLLQVILS